jgi:hypothetical protein
MPKTLQFGKGTKAGQKARFSSVTRSRTARAPITRGAPGIDARRAYPSHGLRLGTTHRASRHQRIASRHDTRRAYPSHGLRLPITHRASRHQRFASRHDAWRVYPSRNLRLGTTRRASGMEAPRVQAGLTVRPPITQVASTFMTQRTPKRPGTPAPSRDTTGMPAARPAFPLSNREEPTRPAVPAIRLARNGPPYKKK